MIKTFENTPNKDFIRSLDFGFIRDEFEYHKRKLKYFGLPSEGLYDIITWDQFIYSFTAVEFGGKLDGPSKQSLLVSRAIQKGYIAKLTLLRGDINDVIINDRDEVGTMVPYPFDIVNLDYGGSVLYPDRKRVAALEVLFNRQKPEDFILFITSNVREFDPQELINTQERILKEIKHFRPNLERSIEKYFQLVNSKQSVIRQTIHVQFMIKSLGEQNKYEVKCIPAVLYKGSNETQLIHYIFSLRFQAIASTRVISDQSILNLLSRDAPKELDEGKLNAINPVLRLPETEL